MADSESTDLAVGVLDQIDTIIVLMLENRSLDTMLGWLHPPGTPVNIVPSDSQPAQFDGITAKMANEVDFFRYTPQYGFADLDHQRWRTPRQDPHEAIGHVFRQMYADGNGHHRDCTWADPARMTGFAWDFTTMPGSTTGEVMGAYTSAELPVLYGLAERFAVSDRWFSPVPTETNPNRAFAFCGTSEGKVDDLPPMTYAAPTIFNALNNTMTSWALYAQTDFTGAPFTGTGHTYSEVMFDGLRSALTDRHSSGDVLPYADLLDALREDRDLPAFCWIEPSWGWGVGDTDDFRGRQGNDYHPPTWVGPAEAALADLVSTLMSSERHWPRTLFIITFDEHGGTWDHVPPPRAQRPDRAVNRKSGFEFDRFGPRVPTILVSAFVGPRTIFRPPTGSTAPFDHTSIIKTVLAWAGADPQTIGGFGARVAAAPMFDHALTDTVLQPHPVLPSVPAGFREQCPIGLHRIPWWARRLPTTELKALADQSTSPSEFLTRLTSHPATSPAAD